MLNALVRVNVAGAAPQASSGAPLEVSLRYEASPECPEREGFVELIGARAPNVRLRGPDSASGLEVVVVIAEHPRGAAGEARILLDGRVRDTREFLGTTCLEVAKAAAISVSFALETWSVDGATPEPEREPPPPEPTPIDQIRAAQAPQPTPGSPGSDVATSAPHGLRFDVGLSPFAVSLWDSPWLFGAGLSLGARTAHAPRPSARLSLLAAMSGPSASAASSYRWVVGEALLCAFRLGDEWSISPCAHGLAGVLHARGEAIDFPLEVTVPWFAAGPALKTSVSIGPSTRLVASVTASVALAERTFVFERPQRVVTRTRSVGWLLSAGVEHDIGGS